MPIDEMTYIRQTDSQKYVAQEAYGLRETQRIWDTIEPETHILNKTEAWATRRKSTTC